IVVTAAGIADHTLIPVLTPVEHESRAVTAVTWQKVPAPVGAQVAPTASSGSAREELLHALRRTAGGSVDLDLVPEEPVEPARILPGPPAGARRPDPAAHPGGDRGGPRPHRAPGRGPHPPGPAGRAARRGPQRAGRDRRAAGRGGDGLSPAPPRIAQEWEAITAR